MSSFGSISINDFDGQTGIVGFNIPELTAANFDAMNANIGALRTSIEDVTTGLVIKEELSSVDRKAASNARSNSPSSQRGNKWFVSMLDEQEFLDPGTDLIPNPGFQKSFSMEIPTADLNLRVNNQDVVWTKGGVSNVALFNALATDINTFVRSPYTGTVDVQRIEAVSRSGG